VGTLTQEVLALEGRREALAKELADVTTRLERIQAALGADAALAPAAAALSPAPAKSAPATKANGGSRRSWFEPGEAAALSQKLLKKPMRRADLVRALADAKGYAGRLSKVDLNRFQVAAYAAIKHAVDAKKLSKATDGTVRLRS
jgi:hypothetical protein